ncbi:MAG: ABC transporter ATP-binding protein [Chloroflexi bacterium]|nr:ABC transporter ATP-binding protein [Chloroflexota bacterium]
MSGVFIEASGLKRHYTLGDQLVKALDGVDLQVKRGELLALMGPSGSGKSTLMNLLGGLDTPDDGEIKVDDKVVTSMDQNELAVYRQREVGFVFQSFNLIPTMTAQQNVEFPMIFSGVAPAKRRERASELLERVGLGDRMTHKPTELSGGQQQRVALARALVNQPSILLGDEPTGNLDSKTGVEILSMLREFNDAGQTIILVTHDPRLEEFAKRVVHMLDGKIVSEDTAAI